MKVYTSFVTIHKKTKETKVIKVGPLESMLPCSASKILDFMIAFREYDYSISDIARHSGVGFKTTLKEVKALESKGIILQSRRIGRARLFRLNPDSIECRHVEMLAKALSSDRVAGLLK